VPKLTAWQAVQDERKQGRKPKSPAIVSLSSKMEAIAGLESDPLKRLIAEQEAKRIA
jgi:hypothetical protein